MGALTSRARIKRIITTVIIHYHNDHCHNVSQNPQLQWHRRRNSRLRTGHAQLGIVACISICRRVPTTSSTNSLITQAKILAISKTNSSITQINNLPVSHHTTTPPHYLHPTKTPHIALRWIQRIRQSFALSELPRWHVPLSTW
jgi:hypothetical protein